MKQCLLLLFSFGACLVGYTQNYHAVQGSSNEAGINVGNNPAAIVNAPYPWDLTLFGTQLKSITNAYTIHNYSLLSSPRKSQYALDNGYFAREADISFNTNFLNGRIALNRNKAIAFGINLRVYASLKTDPYNYTDSLVDINDFIGINQLTPSLNGHLTSSSWMEIFGTYSQTVMDNETGRLNTGITLKVNRGLSAATAKVTEVAVNKSLLPDGINYSVQSGRIDYGYSSNYDRWEADGSGGQNIKNFLTHTEGGASFDLGIEYLIKTQAITTFNDGDDGFYEYEWKIGLSLLDIGFASFKYGSNSISAANPLPNITSGMLEDKFLFVSNIEEVNDSLATVVQNFNRQRGKFNILHPARVVLNVDKYLFDKFFINGDFSLNLSSLAGPGKAYVRELNLVTITPRWETRHWGAYLPVQYNNSGKLWVGAAFKAGPLLLGFHNVSNLFSKTSVQNGGGYLAFIIRPWKTTRWSKYEGAECP